MLERLRINATVGTRCRSGKHAVVGEIRAARKACSALNPLVSYMPLGSASVVSKETNTVTAGGVVGGVLPRKTDCPRRDWGGALLARLRAGGGAAASVYSAGSWTWIFAPEPSIAEFRIEHL